jgi:hypothetical protein
MTGIRINVIKVENPNPKIITIAIGCCISVPSPKPSESGIRPSIVVNAVIIA